MTGYLTPLLNATEPAQGVGQIPTNTLGHDIDRIMEAFKRVSDQGHRSGLAQKQGSLPDDHLMRQNLTALTSTRLSDYGSMRMSRCETISIFRMQKRSVKRCITFFMSHCQKK